MAPSSKTTATNSENGICKTSGPEFMFLTSTPKGNISKGKRPAKVPTPDKAAVPYKQKGKVPSRKCCTSRSSIAAWNHSINSLTIKIMRSPCLCLDRVFKLADFLVEVNLDKMANTSINKCKRIWLFVATCRRKLEI